MEFEQEFEVTQKGEKFKTLERTWEMKDTQSRFGVVKAKEEEEM